MDEQESTLTLEGNVLRATGELPWEQNERFARLCHELMRCDEERLVIDLSEAKFIFSAVVALISNLAITAKEKGKRVEVRINGRLEWILKNIWGEETREGSSPGSMVPEALDSIEIRVVD